MTHPRPLKPNILLITLHDNGRHWGAYGVRTVHSDAIDAIAAEGILSTNYFTVAPICSASRAAMLTGQSPVRNGQVNLPVFGHDLKPQALHLAQRLGAAGYQTHLFGLQHEAIQTRRLGFHHTHATPEEVNRHRKAPEVADALIDFLQTNDRATPFYAQVGFFETHSPYDYMGTEPDSSRGITIPRWLKPTAQAYDLMAGIQGSLKHVDHAIARIDDALRRTGQRDNTLLIVTVDHGLELPRAKHTLYDPGLEIGLTARWPAGGIVGGRKSSILSSNIDLTPTLLDLAGIPSDASIEGKSTAAAWRGESAQPVHEAVFGFSYYSLSRSIRTLTHKLVINGQVRSAPAVPVDLAQFASNSVVLPVELYDLRNDPLEVRNLAVQPQSDQTGLAGLATLGWVSDKKQPQSATDSLQDTRDIQAALSAQLAQWLISNNDPILTGPPPPPWYDKALAALGLARQP